MRNPGDAGFFFSNVALTNLDKVAGPKNNLDPTLLEIHDGYYTLDEEIEVLKPRLKPRQEVADAVVQSALQI